MKFSLVIAVVVLIGGVVFARLVHLSAFLSVAFGLVPALLVAFPAVREWMGPKVTFSRWSIAVGIGLVSTWLVYLAFGSR